MHRFAVATLLLLASACASDATSKAATDRTDVGDTLPPGCREVNSPPPPNVQQGDCGDFIFQLQERLNDLGYSVPNSGYFDETMEQAVRQFQQDDGDLTVDGLVGPKTWAALLEASASG